ncbi:MAG: DUF4157 domain-containing protein [Gemmatimonadetes bacterium]|nr:DUF4157 domain-containing protein [Gemmatimonadota bacterium]
MGAFESRVHRRSHRSRGTEGAQRAHAAPVPTAAHGPHSRVGAASAPAAVPRVHGDFAGVPVRSIQRKALVDSPQSPLEREADAAAGAVCGGAGEAAVQARAIPAAAPGAGLDVQTAIHAAGEGGQPLPQAVRAWFEPRFGRDFSGVRVHAGPDAADGARAVQAHAYTVGHHVVFGAGQFAPGSDAGRRLIAHELAHVVQHGAGRAAGAEVVSRQAVSEAQRVRELNAAYEKAVADADWQRAAELLNAFNREDILARLKKLTRVQIASIYEGALVRIGDRAQVAELTRWAYLDINFEKELAAGRWKEAAVFLNGFNQTDILARLKRLVKAQRAELRKAAVQISSAHIIAAVDQLRPMDALEDQKAKLEADTATGSGKSIGEVASAFSRLKDVSHDLAVLKTGKGVYEGNRCSTTTPGATRTDCTQIVLEILGDTFRQQGRAADWAKVRARYAKNTTARGGDRLSGIDVQAALQSEAGWKGIYWAPDPAYQIPSEELSGAKSNEASYALDRAKKGSYYKNFGKKGYPGVSIDHTVINYAPEAPRSGTASTTTRDVTGLNRLKKLPFGVLSAHGGHHMTVITYGKVIEVHWEEPSSSVDVIEQTDLESWAVGSKSGYHYFASGAIVAPAEDVDRVFK